MIRQLNSNEIIKLLGKDFDSQSIDESKNELYVSADQLTNVCNILKNTKQASFDLLTCISGVDYVEYFEIIYHLLSMKKNQSLVLKLKCFGRDDPVVDSVVDIWKGADLQEREIWDLMGIHFEGHPNLKRVLLWEGFPGHPLRKDFIR